MLNYNQQEKEQISKLIMQKYEESGFDSLSKFAKSIDLLSADLTNIKDRKFIANSSLIGEPKWVKLARIVRFDKRKVNEWKTANTDVFQYVWDQLETCMEESITAILCDDAGIGKTYAAEMFAKKNKYAFHIDCCANPGKAAFVRSIAQAVGVGRYGKLNDLIDDSVFALSQMEQPILILDEAGDLEHNAILILKRLYNALKGNCGFYLIGADGMKKKIKSGIMNEKLGFVEVFSRMGKSFKHIMPKLPNDKKKKMIEMAIQIGKANGLTNTELDILRDKMAEGEVLSDLRKTERAIPILLKKRNGNKNTK